MADAQTGPRDEVADAIASFVAEAQRMHSADVVAAARLVLLDSFAVALGALDHPAAQAARRYAGLFGMPTGSRIWGTRLRASPEVAALVNGAPLRAYDYNDLYVGRKSAGHPSDIVPAVLAVAEWKQASGRDVVHALSVGYEVALHLFDTIDLDKGGWDYVNATAIAGTCAVATLLELNHQQIVEALAITVIPHAASLEIESGELNRRGDLTMWKRFNGSDAVRHSVFAGLLASIGVEGAVRPFVGKFGFLKLIDPTPGVRDELIGRLASRAPFARIKDVTFKRWPVGSRAQSAIQAALEARSAIPDIASIERVRVETQPAVYQHLVASRKDPWAPFSRETADHSLPYIVAAAVIDGTVNPDSFDVEKVLDPRRKDFLQKVEVAACDDLAGASSGEFLSRIEIHTRDGFVARGRSRPPPGHPAQPFTEAEVIGKLQENAAAVLGDERCRRLTETVLTIDRLDDIAALADCLVADAAAR